MAKPLPAPEPTQSFSVPAHLRRYVFLLSSSSGRHRRRPFARLCWEGWSVRWPPVALSARAGRGFLIGSLGRCVLILGGHWPSIITMFSDSIASGGGGRKRWFPVGGGWRLFQRYSSDSGGFFRRWRAASAGGGRVRKLLDLEPGYGYQNASASIWWEHRWRVRPHFFPAAKWLALIRAGDQSRRDPRIQGRSASWWKGAPAFDGAPLFWRSAGPAIARSTSSRNCGIWDTAHNNGVLIYSAARRPRRRKIIADRGHRCRGRCRGLGKKSASRWEADFRAGVISPAA